MSDPTPTPPLPDQQQKVGEYTITRSRCTVAVTKARAKPLVKEYGNEHAAKCAFGRLCDEAFIQTWITNVRIDMIRAGKDV